MSWLNAVLAAACLFIFLYGLRLMSRAAVTAIGPALKKMLVRLVGKPWRAFIAGALITAVLQSSSITSVMVVGLVNARVLTLAQGIGVVIGANVGTTFTAQLLSVSAPRIALPLLISAVILYLAPLPQIRHGARCLFGFGLMLYGLEGMAASLAPLKDSPLFSAWIVSAGQAPWRGITTGFMMAAALQSSSAVIGLVLGLALEGAISLPAAMAVVMGADLGTCTTALIASYGMKRTARAAALSHFLFNLFSLLIAVIFFRHLVMLASASADTLQRSLANGHTLYNLLGAAVMLPLASLFADLLEGKARRIR